MLWIWGCTECCNNFRPLFSHLRSEFPKRWCTKSGLRLLRHSVRPQIHKIYIINEFPTEFHNSTASISIHLKIKEMACYFFSHYCMLKKYFVFLKSGGPKDHPRKILGPYKHRKGEISTCALIYARELPY